MSPEAQRIAIAKACGWTYVASYALSGIPPNGIPADARVIPDYLTDLNAMHEAEKVLKGERPWDYQNFLLCQERKKVGPFCMATAAQRAEAFLKTLGLWEDGK